MDEHNPTREHAHKSPQQIVGMGALWEEEEWKALAADPIRGGKGSLPVAQLASDLLPIAHPTPNDLLPSQTLMIR